MGLVPIEVVAKGGQYAKGQSLADPRPQSGVHSEEGECPKSIHRAPQEPSSFLGPKVSQYRRHISGRGGCPSGPLPILSRPGGCWRVSTSAHRR